MLARPTIRGATAVALLVAGLSPLGDQALAAAQDAVQEVVRATHPSNDAVTVLGNGKAVDDPNAINVPYDPNIREDILPAEQPAQTR